MGFVWIAISILASSAIADEGTIKLSEILNQNEFTQSGLSKLTQDELSNLDDLITDLLMQAYKKGYQDAGKPPLGNIYSGVGSGHWIEGVGDNGELVTLEDGSIWKIAPVDQIYTFIWLPVTSITVVVAKDGYAGFDFLLINTDDGESVHAQFMGQ